MNNREKIKLNLIYSVIAQVISISISILLPRFILIGYGSEVNGLINSILQMISYLAIFEAGLQAVGLNMLYREISLNNKESINNLLTEVHHQYNRTSFFYLLGLVIFSFCYSMFITISNLSPFSVFIICFFSGFSNVLFFFFQSKYFILLKADGRNYAIVNTQSFIGIIRNITKILLISLGYSIIIVVLASFVVSIIQIVVIRLYIKKNYPWINLENRSKNIILPERNYALVHELSFLIFQNTDVMLLTLLSDLTMVSIYSVYKMIMNTLRTLLLLLFNNVTFALGQMFNSDRQRFIYHIDLIDSIFSAIVFSIFSVCLLMIEPFIALYTKGVGDANYILKYLGVLFVVSEILTVIRNPMLNVITFDRKFKATANRAIIETAINLVISTLLALSLGIYGVLIGTIVALLYRNIDIIFFANHVVLDRSCKKNLKKMGINFLIFFGFVLFSELHNELMGLHTYTSLLMSSIIIMIVSSLFYFSAILWTERNFLSFIIKVIKGQ